VASVFLAAAHCTPLSEHTGPTLSIPEVTEPVVIDGQLNEPCYRQHAPLSAFVVAGSPAAPVPRTKAWVFWSEEQLLFAFDCEERTPAEAAPTANEQDVNGQDRVELFFWSGDPAASYFCLELASGGAVHDYEARFYRQFDDRWSPAGLNYRTVATPAGYRVEASLPRTALEAASVKLAGGQQFRLGLFRADFSRLNGNPAWITWVDRDGAPDFHVAESFGSARLERAR
jgi:hypothetical protein